MHIVYVYIYIPLDPKTMNNEGFFLRPQNMGVITLKIKIVGSHGMNRDYDPEYQEIYTRIYQKLQLQTLPLREPRYAPCRCTG